MKKLFLSFVTALWVVSLPAQESDFRFGKVSEEELRMERYEKDPDANAVVLYEETSIHYLVGNQLSLIRDYFVRIKVLKSDGADVANVELPYIFQHENYATSTPSPTTSSTVRSSRAPCAASISSANRSTATTGSSSSQSRKSAKEPSSSTATR